MSEELRKYLDLAKVSSGYGKTSSGLINVLRGHNHRGAGNIVPANSDEQGFVFFTRPNLNLSYDNVNASRRLSFLSVGDQNSLSTAIRCILSPAVDAAGYLNPLSGSGNERNQGKQYQSYTGDNSTETGGTVLPRSTIIDDRYPFIPLLSNTLLSLTGWEDFTLDAFTSKEGMRKEVVSWVDSPGDMFGQFDLTATFQNVEGDPVTALMAVWTEYAARVAEGTMVPYANCIVENEIDYLTRIYRFVMDPTRTFIRKIADVGYAFPSAVPNGAPYNYNAEEFISKENHQISIRFTCVGARYNDPITVENFNRVVQMFNTDMTNAVRESRMVKIKVNERALFNYRGYPRISPSNELEWWVPKDEYNRVLRAFEKYPEVTFEPTPYGANSYAYNLSIDEANSTGNIS